MSRHLIACLSELLNNADLDPAAHEYCLAEALSLYELFGGRILVLSHRVANDHSPEWG